jgi:hypothetical protein
MKKNFGLCNLSLTLIKGTHFYFVEEDRLELSNHGRLQVFNLFLFQAGNTKDVQRNSAGCT